MLPMVAAVTGLEPHTAAKQVHAAMVPTASAPGSLRSQICAAVKRSRPIVVAASASPIITKSGTTTSTKFADWAKAMLPSCAIAAGGRKR